MRRSRFAILFLIHFWDDFAARQLARLRAVAGAGEIFVLYDTASLDANLNPEGAVGIPVSESRFSEMGYVIHRHGNPMWLNTDYNLYYFNYLYPDQYDYQFLIEYDCVTTVSFDKIVQFMVDTGSDFVGSPMAEPTAHWYWTKTARHYYDDADVSGRLMGFTGYHKDFVTRLAVERFSAWNRAKLESFPAGADQLEWPNNEAFVGSEINRLGARELPLSQFGDTSEYDWFPPSVERELSALDGPMFIHPMLNWGRFTSSILKHGWLLEDLFVPESHLSKRLATYPTQKVVDAFLEHLTGKGSIADIEDLNRLCSEHSSGVDPVRLNVAAAGTATPGPNCILAQTGGRLAEQPAVNEQVAWGLASLTPDQNGGWCVLDLRLNYSVRVIDIGLETETSDPGDGLKATVSEDGIVWTDVITMPETRLTLTSTGLVISSQHPIRARFIRFENRSRGALVLTAIGVFI